MTKSNIASPRVLAAIINTEEGTIVSTNTDPKNATQYRLSVRELNGCNGGTKFLVVEFRTTGNNLSYYLEKFKVPCDSAKDQLRIWNNEAFIVGKQRLLNTAQETLNHLNEAQDEVSELYKDHDRKAELIGDLIEEQIREAQDEVAEIESDIRNTKKVIAKLQENIA